MATMKDFFTMGVVACASRYKGLNSVSFPSTVKNGIKKYTDTVTICITNLDWSTIQGAIGHVISNCTPQKDVCITGVSTLGELFVLL